MVRTPAKKTVPAIPRPRGASSATHVCYNCSKHKHSCFIAEGASKCAYCTTKNLRCNINKAVPGFKPELMTIYMAELTRLNPPGAPWTPPNTNIKPKKVTSDFARIPTEASEGRLFLSKVAKAIQAKAEELENLTKELDTLRSKYQGTRILLQLTEETPKNPEDFLDSTKAVDNTSELSDVE
ncbi:hypothetical protein BCV70DRAFT_219893 [Testicularia cyperi]|uniref:Zn(2)-C6 fungal-type domain-containing protein n=1 Tax=Testicularia cyperi TaxID=1882483 RepID=A0A317XEJ9_9BASI|nr:hypothetical protein BCV70DRAFT_219893 [Testicularia cyperi]